MVACKVRRVSDGGGDGRGKRDNVAKTSNIKLHFYSNFSRPNNTPVGCETKTFRTGQSAAGMGEGGWVETVIKKLGAIVVAARSKRKEKTNFVNNDKL